MRKRIYIFDELHEYGLTNPKIADVLKPIVGTEMVVCDSSEPKSIQELKDNGIKAVGAIKGKDSVNYGIQFLQQHEIIIDKRCQETINEFEQYQWKKLRTGETVDVPVDKNNHHIDDIRYAMESEMADAKKKVIPRMKFVGQMQEREVVEPDDVEMARAKLKEGEQLITIWEQDKIVGFEILKPSGRRRGISIPGLGTR